VHGWPLHLSRKGAVLMEASRRPAYIAAVRPLLLMLVVLCGCRGANDYLAKIPKVPDAGNEDLMPAPPNATLLATSQNAPRALQVVGDSVVWLNQGGRPVGEKGVFSVSGPGAPVKAHATGGTDILAVAADSTAVYWLAPREGKIYKQARGGGEVQTVAETEGLTRAMVIDDTDVYWAENEAIYRVPKAGGKVQTVSPAGLPDVLAVDEAFVYWYSSVQGVLNRVPKKGGARAKVHADDQHTLHTFFIDGNDLFVTYGSESAMVIQRLPKAGGAAVTVADKLQAGTDFAIDGSNIYWITEDDIWKVPRSGGSATKAVEKLRHGTDVAVDDRYIYWADRTRIQRVAK